MVRRRISFESMVLFWLAFHCRDSAVLGQAGSFSDDVGSLLNSVQKTLGNIQDYVGNEKGCKFECSDGSKPKANPQHVVSSNGCGAFGVNLDSQIAFKDLATCCDEHDYCYDTCNSGKEACDRSFKKCLEKICKKAKSIVSADLYQGCKSTADVLYAGTVALGCKAYRDAQRNACICKRKSPTKTEL